MSSFDIHKVLLPVKRYWEKWVENRKKLSVRERRNQNLFIGICTVCGVLLLVCVFNIIQSSYQLQKLKQEEVSVEKKCEKLHTSESKLKHEVSMLKDSSYVEKLARARYFLSKQGEQIYIFPKESDVDESSTLDNQSNVSQITEEISTISSSETSTTQSQ